MQMQVKHRLSRRFIAIHDDTISVVGDALLGCNMRRCDIQTPDFTFALEQDDECPAVVQELCVAESKNGPVVPNNTTLCVLLHEPDDDNASEPEKDDDERKD